VWPLATEGSVSLIEFITEKVVGSSVPSTARKDYCPFITGEPVAIHGNSVT
jgi:hypothetical protein